jgi:hypothetical protein
MAERAYQQLIDDFRAGRRREPAEVDEILRNVGRSRDDLTREYRDTLTTR